MRNNSDIAGNLSFLNLADVLQLLGSNGATGTLKLTSRYATGPGYIYLSKGNPINASNNSQQGLEALLSLFGWLDGEFDFTQDSVDSDKVIKKNRMEIILDALRMLDEGEIEKLGPVTAEKLTASAPGKSSSVPFINGPLVDYMYVVDEESFYDGEKIIKTGQHGSWIWAILEGAIDIIKETPDGPLTILRLGNGAFIGSLSSFLVQGNIRSATAVAVGNVQLAVLDSQRLAKEFAVCSSEFRNFLISFDQRLKRATESAVAIKTGNNSFKQRLSNKKPYIKQGKKEQRLFKIVKGEATIVRKSDSGLVPLVDLVEGDFFGQIPFLDMGHEPDSASVLISKDLKASKVDPVQLQKEYNKLSPTFQNLIDSIATCISVTSAIACTSQPQKVRKQ
ncbi:MAG: cyclic nucleotide-binding domain-containing protein [Desulfobacterales bacterium]|nr:cyclic nucleotide-binding domain-containing protein [Desulfobacterales bacterium]